MCVYEVTRLTKKALSQGVQLLASLDLTWGTCVSTVYT